MNITIVFLLFTARALEVRNLAGEVLLRTSSTGVDEVKDELERKLQIPKEIQQLFAYDGVSEKITGYFAQDEVVTIIYLTETLDKNIRDCVRAKVGPMTSVFTLQKVLQVVVPNCHQRGLTAEELRQHIQQGVSLRRLNQICFEYPPPTPTPNLDYGAIRLSDFHWAAGHTYHWAAGELDGVADAMTGEELRLWADAEIPNLNPSDAVDFLGRMSPSEVKRWVDELNIDHYLVLACNEQGVSFEDMQNWVASREFTNAQIRHYVFAKIATNLHDARIWWNTYQLQSTPQYDDFNLIFRGIGLNVVAQVLSANRAQAFRDAGYGIHSLSILASKYALTTPGAVTLSQKAHAYGLLAALPFLALPLIPLAFLDALRGRVQLHGFLWTLQHRMRGKYLQFLQNTYLHGTEFIG